MVYCVLKYHFYNWIPMNMAVLDQQVSKFARFLHSKHGYPRYWDIIHASAKKLAYHRSPFGVIWIICHDVVSMMHVFVQNATVLFHFYVYFLQSIPKFCQWPCKFLELISHNSIFCLGKKFFIIYWLKHFVSIRKRKLTNWMEKEACSYKSKIFP